MMGGGFEMGIGWIFGLLVLVGVVLLVVVAVRAVGGGITTGTTGGAETDRSHRAREILDERYARGELTTEEYRERLTTMGED